MPTSFHKHISDVMDYVIYKKPKSVLDIGIGNGKWGFLTREYLDIYGKGANWKPETRNTVIEGIEAYSPYVEINPAINYVYNKVYIGQAEKIYFENKKKYDLVFIMDVIEHIPKVDGVMLLNQIIKESKNVIVSVPLGNFLYDFKGENKFESHLSVWENKEMRNFPKFIKEKIYPLTLSNGIGREVGVFYYGN